MTPTLTRLTEAIRNASKRTSLAPAEKRATVALSRAFATQGKAVLTRFRPLERLFVRPTFLQEAIADEDWAPIWSGVVVETLTLLQTPILDVATEGLRSGIRAQAGRVGIDFDLAHPAATAYLEQHAAETVAGINETTRGALGRILVQAADDGWSYNRTATAIRAKFADFSRKRARTIAITEAGNAYEQSGQLVGQQLESAGIPMEKAWSNVAGACPLCIANAAQGWIPFAQPFASGHMQPLGHPICRCSGLLRQARSVAA